MSRRLLRINELIKRELSTIIRRDVNFEGALVGVSEVDITPDLKQAHVYLSVIGDDRQRLSALTKLQERRGFLQSRLSKRVVLKHTPQLIFSADDSVERGVHILNILDEVEADSSGDMVDPDAETAEVEENLASGEFPDPDPDPDPESGSDHQS